MHFEIERDATVESGQVVLVVDDDQRIREALSELLSSFGMHVVTFSCAAEYLGARKPEVPYCLLLDMALPDASGLEVQRRIAEADHAGVVFITGHGDIPSSVRAIKSGAVDFLTKPFKEADLIRAIDAAIAQSCDSRRRKAELAELQQRLSSLTPRERDVLPLVVSGLLNKQAAAELGISEITLQIHRGNIMKKMAAVSLPELVRMAASLDIPITHSRRSQK
jgi:FixJ family two-component response regulator